jgi:hypothetical protein
MLKVNFLEEIVAFAVISKVFIRRKGYSKPESHESMVTELCLMLGQHWLMEAILKSISFLLPSALIAV